MSSLSNVQEHLRRQFTTQRLVIWHDAEGEYSAELDSLELDGVTVLRVENNEYALKNRLLHDELKGKFLLYRGTSVLSDVGNWLLDLELAYGVFTADQAALVSQDLGLHSNDIEAVVREHGKFFRASKRLNSLKKLVSTDDDADRLRAKMAAVLLGQSEHSMLEITRALLVENAEGEHAKYDALVEYGLDTFHWTGVSKIYGYKAEHPSVDDFVLWMFQQAINGFSSDMPGALRNIQLDFASLRNDRRSTDSLAVLARHAAEALDYATRIENTPLKKLVDDFLFEDVERKIISVLAQGIVDRTLTTREVSATIRLRKSSIWFAKYRELYTALNAAAALLSEIKAATYEISSFDDGLDQYRAHWFRIDQLYRQFYCAAQRTEYSGPLETLQSEVERHYINCYLYKLGNAWQQQVETVSDWRSQTLTTQTHFFADYIEPITSKGNRKAVVIISDALRYEVAEELGSLIRQEDGFDADLQAMLGVLPSYTQLGMAALLPHKILAHSHTGDPVLVDGQRSDGTVNRNKVLAQVGGFAIQAEEVLSMKRDKLRELYGSHQVLYVYHDRIDATGDKPRTERQVFEAVADTLHELVKLIRKLANANVTNILITADHGFLYQDSQLADTAYLSTKPEADELVVTNRRFVLGRGLKDDPAFRKFEPEQLGLRSDLEVQIPKSIHRLRLPGSGSRYVHGGAALQEIVLPVLAINKKRKSDTRLVNIEIRPETDKITTGQIVVKLFQLEPVTEKVQARRLRVGLYAGEMLISNQAELSFEERSTDQRDRYQSVQILLSQDADEFNNRTVELRLEEQVPNTSMWRVYQRVSYTLRRSFTTDFDF